VRYKPRPLKKLFAFLSLFALVLCSASGERISPLAPKPKWSDLDRYQQTITRSDFQFLLEEVYAPNGAWKPFIEIDETSASIQTSVGGKPYVLHFAPEAKASKPVPRFWRGKSQMAGRPSNKPLAGVRIAIDPGHIGGSWAKIEERWFRIGNSKPVTEGDMTLLVAKLLSERLRELGAKVYLTRTKPSPVTPLRPDRLKKEAVESLRDQGASVTEANVKSESERLFYRVGEIRRRAELINEKIKPDLVICLHFNAEAWGNPDRPSLTDKNHLHFLITGCFSGRELTYDDQRFNMLKKLLSRAYREELAVTEAIASSMARATGLEPYVYQGSNAVKVGSSPYVWARNLLANRLFECPVVYVEPYVMNSHEVFARVQEGDYKGERAVAGRMRQSIFREYANSVADGLVKYYSSNP